MEIESIILGRVPVENEDLLRVKDHKALEHFKNNIEVESIILERIAQENEVLYDEFYKEELEKQYNNGTCRELVENEEKEKLRADTHLLKSSKPFSEMTKEEREQKLSEDRKKYDEDRRKKHQERLRKIFQGQPYFLPDKYSKDEYQSEVINIEEGHHLILASAGCGKTDILAERVVNALSQGILLEDMLCLTFTNRAARGMRERIENRLGESSKDTLFVGNLHRFCSLFLFKNGIISQTSNILDEIDSNEIIKGFIDEDAVLLNEIKVLKSNAETHYIYKNYELAEKLENEAKQLADSSFYYKIQHLIHQLRHKHDKDTLLHTNVLEPYIDEVALRHPSQRGQWFDFVDLYDNIEQFLDSQEYPQLFLLYRMLNVAKKYEVYKTKHELLDFDDLLLFAHDKLVEDQEEIKKYSWIQVDEVQDLNRLQLKIIDLLTDFNQKHVVLYLGDEQQAIYSFMGASLETLDYLNKKCGGEGHLHRLYNNYRSPKYLMDVFNHYAAEKLGTPPELLPRSNNDRPKGKNDLSFWVSLYMDQEVDGIVELALSLEKLYPQERIAILVPSNNTADIISEKFTEGGIKHFKISGQDVFSSKEVQTLLAHFNVVNFERNLIAWSRILCNFRIFPSPRKARNFVKKLDEYYLCPSDFLMFKNDSYISNFVRDYKDDFVIFDTETTGLDIYNDDIVQIAAIKLHAGEIIGTLNIILHTDKEIPEFLGKDRNPLIAEYAERENEHLDREVGLKLFLNFVGLCPILGHNANYDYHILDYNLRRDCDIHNISQLLPVYYDSLKIMRIVEPGLKSYKLKDLLSQLKLEGENSHLADADIMATKSVVDYAIHKAEPVIPFQKEIFEENEKQIRLFVQKYKKYYQHTQSILYQQDYTPGTPALISEMEYFYSGIKNDNVIEEIQKYQYIKEFFEKNALASDDHSSLHELLDEHVMDLNTYKEADLCDSSIIKERFFISTVHKAKGLEFENVIVSSVNKGTYPFYRNRNPLEDARKLYVAMSRAKLRLYLSYARRKRGTSPRTHEDYDFVIDRSPYIYCIRDFFEELYS